jgi:hypothetical protein
MDMSVGEIFVGAKSRWEIYKEKNGVTPLDMINPNTKRVSDEDAKTLFPQGWKTVKPYLRVLPQPK